MFDRDTIPAHLLNATELDFSGDLFTDPLEGSWFRLGAWTHKGKRDKRGLLETVERRSFLIEPSDFSKLFPGLHAIGNVIGNMGSASGSVWSGLDGNTYRYSPFHKFEFSFSPVIAEPLVFARPDAEKSTLFINPDLWLFFGMEEKAPGVWWHKRRGRMMDV